MFKKLLIVSTWLTATVITLIATLALYQTVSTTPYLPQLLAQEATIFASQPNAALAYAALPTAIEDIQTAVRSADARPVMIDKYLQRYDSPLLGYGQYIVLTADRYHLDPYLFVAIAQQESNLCKKIPDNSYNCWGWGIHSRGTLRFDSYNQAIETVIKGLTQDYIGEGLIAPEEIMEKYTPLSNGSWAEGVNQFLEQLSSGNF